MMLASFGTAVLTFGLVTVSLLLIGLILLQKNRGSGLSGAFGGVGGHTAFGTKTGDFLTWVTVSLTAIFLLLSIVGNYVFEPTKLTTPSAATPAAPSPQSQTLPLIPSGPPPGMAPEGITPVKVPVPPVSPAPAPTSQPAP